MCDQMNFGVYDDRLRPSKEVASIVNVQLTQCHHSQESAYVLVTFVYRPAIISIMNAWKQVNTDIDSIFASLSKFPGFYYAVSSVEPHLGEVPVQTIYLNDNRDVEIQRFFESRAYVPSMSAGEICEKAVQDCTFYTQQCKSLQHNVDIYNFMFQYFGFRSAAPIAGYPHINIAVSLKHNPTRLPTHSEVEAFISRTLPAYIGPRENKGRSSSKFSRESTVQTKSINDPAILQYIIKNGSRLTHQILIGSSGIRLHNAPPEIVSIFASLNMKGVIHMDVPELTQLTTEHVQVEIGEGKAPPTSFPISLPVGSKINMCRMMILNYMRKHHMYIDASTGKIYKLVVGSSQTYTPFGTKESLIEHVGVSNLEYSDLIRQNEKQIFKDFHPGQLFYDSIRMTFKWVEYTDFCLNLSSGITTPKDGRYPCFRFFSNVRLGQKTWTRETVPTYWFWLLYNLGIVQYSQKAVDPSTLEPTSDLLTTLYEILVPRYTRRKNISFSDTAIFDALLAPIKYMYEGISGEYSNLITRFTPEHPFVQESFDASQVVIFERFSPSKQFGIPEILKVTADVNNAGTRSILLEDVSTGLATPQWAMKGSGDDFTYVSPQFQSSFKTFHISESASPEFRRGLSKFSYGVLQETGLVIYHLSILYFASTGGIFHLTNPTEIDRYARWERAAEYITGQTSKAPEIRSTGTEEVPDSFFSLPDPKHTIVTK